MNNLNQLPKSRHEAICLNSDYYFLNKKCKNGHLDKRNTKTSKCVSCSREYSYKYYYSNKQHLLKLNQKYYLKNKYSRIKKSCEWQSKNWNKALKIKHKSKMLRIKLNKQIIENFKKECINCGETDKRCLDCHHIKNKKYNIATLVKDGYSKKILLTELSKCEVLCSNCHRLKKYINNTKSLGKKKYFIRKLKENAKCKICGITGVPILDFHHVNPKTKILGIGSMERDKKYTLEDIKNEINKCIIICVNCHRKIHS